VTLKEKYDYKFSEIAEIICKTPHYVTAKVGLAKRLAPEVQEMIIRDWDFMKCIPNTLNEDHETAYEPNINVIEDVARLPNELQKAAYEAIKENAMDKKDALEYLRSLKNHAEMQKMAEDVKILTATNADQSVFEPTTDKELRKCLKKIEKDLDQLSVRIKASEFVEKRNVIPELESLIEKLYALCSEFKAQDSNSTEMPIKIH
jgi:ParB family chromosome partitioning protein